MVPTTDGDYEKLFTEVIKRQIAVLGPSITLAKVRNVPGIVVDDIGNVTKINGDPQTLLNQLINQFVELSGLIVKKTMESILSSYPALAGIAPAGLVQGGMATPQAQAAQPVSQPAAPPVPPVQPAPSQPPPQQGSASPDLASMDDLKIQELNKMFDSLNQQEKPAGN